MKTILEESKFDTMLETSDWRYGASIVGLIKYFKYHEIEHEEGHDFIKYNNCDITEDRYLFFAEYHFGDKMHHKALDELVGGDEFTEEQEDFINKKLTANTVMKKVFGKEKFDGTNKEEILDLIDENRLLLIKATFVNGKSLYSKFTNSGCFLKEKGKTCRLLGYYVDPNRKTKSISYNWDVSTYNFVDDEVFDFIPFGFNQSREAFFINNNLSIKMLIAANRGITNSENPRESLFCSTANSATFIKYAVEIIVKKQGDDNNFYETMFIRDEAIKVFEQIKEYKGIIKNVKISKDLYLNLEKEVTNNIINGIGLDSIIEKLLHLKENYSYNIDTLIRINNLINGGNYMDKKMKMAYASARALVEKFSKEKKANKIDSYKHKLVSSLTFKDYDKFCEILLQLSAYSGVVFTFAYDLFEDFDANKRLAYTFVNALNTSKKKEDMVDE
ncbi:MAG: type I CRISPR-associated protein Cas8a1/Csx8 [Alkaliphilus sp.]|nr:type I CRISPR-associated protein Cas8a1/Csx8 [Alkaliphilus sp. AH-315-G20]PHS32814.1 MAG: type I CRISPR-associated protein Cas8a1/Csx8 [Alkaliphilus sp.]